jgi:hypothetical protein
MPDQGAGTPKLFAQALGIGAAVVWAEAVVLWWSAHWHLNQYDRLDHLALPIPTELIISPVGIGLPFLLAALLTVTLIHHRFRSGPRSLAVAIWLLSIAIAYAILAIFALTLPLIPLCGLVGGPV